MIRLTATTSGLVLEQGKTCVLSAMAFSLDALFAASDPVAFVRTAFAAGMPLPGGQTAPGLRAPIQSKEIWAAGVTYLRSKNARMAESKDAGGGTFYDKVDAADRPELFFKATPHRVVGPGGAVRIRADSKWNVPEPDLTLAINSAGKIFGFTIGNDMSSRDIEGENPLYLPQAKSYHHAASIGPSLIITDSLPGPATVIAIEIRRGGCICGRDNRRPDRASAALAGRLVVSRELFSPRMLPHDGSGRGTAGRIHASRRRRNPYYGRPSRYAR